MAVKRLLLLVNPFGGGRRGRQVLQKVQPLFQNAGTDVKVIETTHAGHAVEVARTSDPEEFDAVCALGGDGTLHEVVNGMLTRTDGKSLPVGLIPAGSGNSFMRTMGVLDPVDAVYGILADRRRSVDIARVLLSGRIVYACNIVGWGLVTDILRRSEKYRWWGENRYTVASLVEVLISRRRIARLTADGHEWEGEFSFVLACNTRFTGKGMLMAPDADLSDGYVDLVVVQRASRVEMLQLLPKVFDGSYLDSPRVEYRKVKSFTLQPEMSETVNIDGELMESSPVQVKMLPGAITFLA
ncbi:diacylglycerol/lipid kinase family protein [Candidatus Neomarinimicrobiota bacterium]